MIEAVCIFWLGICVGVVGTAIYNIKKRQSNFGMKQLWE